MQINELLLKNFGKFHDRQINLEEGINLIHGENESGKSTIHTFIKGMLFGIERGRGRAAQNDTFSIYEPWDNPNYYSGTLKFASGGKHFRIERNFDKYSKKAELVCIEDGEVLSVEPEKRKKNGKNGSWKENMEKVSWMRYVRKNGGSIRWRY